LVLVCVTLSKTLEGVIARLNYVSAADAGGPHRAPSKV